MRDYLTKHEIPTTSIMDATDALTEMSTTQCCKFNAEFGLSLSGDDALTAACFAATAILSGADTVEKVVAFVAKRMLGHTAKPEPKAVTIVFSGPAVVETEEVTIVPVVVDKTNVVAVKGKLGRKRLGNSDFCKVVALIDANKGADRDTLKQLIIAEGINSSSAGVYLWRYGKGERE